MKTKYQISDGKKWLNCSKADQASNRGKKYGQFTGVDLEMFMASARGCGFADIDRELLSCAS